MPAADDVGVVAPRDEGGRAPSRRGRLAAHASVLFVVLLLGGLVVDPHELFFVDEGAVMAQVDALEGGSWEVPHPAPEIDPTGRWFPIENSTITPDGDGIPYDKHVVYPLILSAAHRVGGMPAVVSLSILGTVVAAVAAALLAEMVSAGRGPLALWVAGLGSPLLFDSYLVVAHTLAAACLGLATMWVVRSVHRPGTLAPAVASVLIAAAVLLRSEAVLFGLALGASILVLGARTSSRRFAVAGYVVGSTSLAYVLDGILSATVAGAGGTAPFTIDDGGWLAGRLDGAYRTLLAPSYLGAASWAAQVAVSVTMALVMATAFACRSAARGGDVLAPRVLGAASAVSALGAAVLAPAAIVPGLLMGFPAVLWLVPWVREVWSAGSDVRVLMGTVVAFAAAVLLTQYSVGGGLEWGGRYFALAIPLLVALLVVVLDAVSRDVDRRTARLCIAAMVLVTASMGARSLWTMKSEHDDNSRLMAGVLDAIAAEWRQPGGGDPLVLTTSFIPPRLGWQSHDDVRWLLVSEEELADAASAAVRSGEHRLLLLSPGPLHSSPDALAGVDVAHLPPRVAEGGWVVQPLEAQAR